MRSFRNTFSYTERIGWLDMAKAFAILMVFIGHKTANNHIEQYIYSFHLPLFFWLSGFTFNAGKYSSFRIFLYRRIRTLLVPYFVFAISSFLFWFVVVRSLSIRGEVLSLNPLYPFFGIFYSIGVGSWRQPLDTALWFLPCLFVTEMLFWLMSKYVHGFALAVALIISAIVGYCSSIWSPFRLPWSADVALTAVVFYAAGNLTKYEDERVNKLQPLWRIAAMVLLAVSSFSLSLMNSKADMNYNFCGNPLLFYSAAFAGIYFWYGVIRTLPTIRAVSYMGQNTIIMIGLVGISSFIMRGLHYLLTGMLFAGEKTYFTASVIYSLLDMALLVPVIYLINRYTPFILGRAHRFADYALIA